MDRKCLNSNCNLNRRTLFIPTQELCSYYNVQYNTNLKVCSPCLGIFENSVVSKRNFDNVSAESEVGENEVSIIRIKRLHVLPEYTPKTLKQIKPTLNPGDKVYVMEQSVLHPWVEATVQSAVSETGQDFRIIFDDGTAKVLGYKHLACKNPSLDAQYPIRTRVIAKSQDQLTDEFYVGVVAELPKINNGSRYLIFYDNGYTLYVNHNNIRQVCGQSRRVKDDVHENVREFIDNYLENYPDRPLVRLEENQRVHTELNNRWVTAKVNKIDASLVQLQFPDTQKKHTEWIYRGSKRLGRIISCSSNQNKRIRDTDVNKLLNRPYIELENLTENDKTINIADSDNNQNTEENSGVIKSIGIPACCSKPQEYIAHKCNERCMSWVKYDYSLTKYMNVLSIPLYYGFIRFIKTVEKTKLKKVTYTTPCGHDISDEERMYEYLKMTQRGNSQMTIDLFSFDCMVDPLSSFSVPEEFIRILDISNEMEFKTISVVNSLNKMLPKKIHYINDRKTTPNIDLNIDSNFLCGCDCIDNCEDKKKCSCWQLTNEGPNYFNEYDNIGYSFKRLHEQVITGIYECNASCKCKKTCLNRVAQEPMKQSLQLFLTKNKGWGVRTLADIPKGSFICTFLGEVRSDKDTENDFLSNWGEYMAELDFIEYGEKIKDDYESDVVQSEEESSYYTSSSDNEELSDDETYDPNWTSRNKINEMVVSKMSLRQKRSQDTNAKVDDKHELSQQKDKSEHKVLRSYLDEDCEKYTLDAKVSGNIGRYFNHSCEPNIFVQNVFVDTHDPRFPWIAFFASSNIPAGTELAWDYNYTVDCVEDKQIQCYCGAQNCKGRLL